jgi:hypothetical protein
MAERARMLIAQADAGQMELLISSLIAVSALRSGTAVQKLRQVDLQCVEKPWLMEGRALVDSGEFSGPLNIRFSE